MRDPEHLRKPRVLVVDDEPRMRELLMDVLPEMGFSPSAARTAEEAAKVMEADPREILILDLQLPLMQGMDLFRQVRQRWPETQVIVLTGFGALEAAQVAIRLDVVDFLSKPCHLSDVEVALERARRRLLGPGPGLGSDDPEVSDEAEGPPDGPETLGEVERQQIMAALDRNDGNRSKAAAELGISRRTLYNRLAEYRRTPLDR